jgi:hypothetical protein
MAADECREKLDQAIEQVSKHLSAAQATIDHATRAVKHNSEKFMQDDSHRALKLAMRLRNACMSLNSAIHRYSAQTTIKRLKQRRKAQAAQAGE